VANIFVTMLFSAPIGAMTMSAAQQRALNTSLLRAVALGQHDLVSHIVAAGADVNVKEGKYTALALAAGEYLKADQELQAVSTRFFTNNNVMKELQNKKANYLGIIQLLAKKGADKVAVQKLIAFRYVPEVQKAYLAGTEEQEKGGLLIGSQAQALQRAMETAVLFGDREIVELLTAAGAKITDVVLASTTDSLMQRLLREKQEEQTGPQPFKSFYVR
jgi:ankyrin repeat protein